MERGSLAAPTAAADLTPGPAETQGEVPLWREPPIGILGRAVRGLDRLLRRHKHIYEFSQHPSCLLRVAIVPAGKGVVLSEGTQIPPDERVADLHFWNERVPRLPASGPNLGWAARTRRGIEVSLIELAEHLQARSELHDVRAIRADAAFVTRLGPDRLARLAGLFGFEREPDSRPKLSARIHHVFADFLVLALIWTFNPRALQRFGARVIRPRRERFWMSRETLLRRYGRTSISGSRRWVMKRITVP